MKKIWIIILLILLTSCSENSNYEQFEDDETESSTILVYISGEVVYPGLYYLNTDSILNELVIKAGGFTKDALITGINLSRNLSDQEMVIIPKKGTGDEQNSQININTATLEDFLKIPGIGESKAANILDYRNKHGSFKSIEEIKNVKGIGDTIFEEIKEYIRV